MFQFTVLTKWDFYPHCFALVANSYAIVQAGRHLLITRKLIYRLIS